MGKELKPSEMNPNDLPDERAFQDEFTREFLQSVEETRPGYYPFLSKTGKYKMDFPRDGHIGKQAYSIRKTNFEFIVGGISGTTKAGFTLVFHGENDKANVEDHLNRFKKRIGKDDFDFIINEGSESTIYHYHFNRNNFDKNVAYIQNLKSTGGIEIILTVNCATIDNCHNREADVLHQKFLNWIKSIKFINVDENID